MNCQVPNGRDCFGCCTVVVDGMQHDIFLGDQDCSLDSIDNCEMCTPNDECDEECHPEDCEVCFGQELPPECERLGEVTDLEAFQASPPALDRVTLTPSCADARMPWPDRGRR